MSGEIVTNFLVTFRAENVVEWDKSWTLISLSLIHNFWPLCNLPFSFYLLKVVKWCKEWRSLSPTSSTSLYYISVFVCMHNIFLPEIKFYRKSHILFTIEVKLISCLPSNFPAAILTLHWIQLKFLTILKIWPDLSHQLFICTILSILQSFHFPLDA